jgi:hypothetical protein
MTVAFKDNGDAGEEPPNDDQAVPKGMEHHLVRCRRCEGVAYKPNYYHCCICRRVFRSATAFERHQMASEARGKPASDATLGRLGMTKNKDGVWMRRGTWSETTDTSAPRPTKKSPRTAAA